MDRIAQARARVDVARSMPEVLSASWLAFEQLLATIREHEDRVGGLFAAFVMAAASAADGRDALIAAPSLPVPLRAAPARVVPTSDSTASRASDLASADDVADALAELCQLLAATLMRAASHALDRSDQTACAEAARCAEAMWSLLAWPVP